MLLFNGIVALAITSAGADFFGDLHHGETSARHSALVQAVANARSSVVALKIAKSDGAGGMHESTATGVIVDERGDIVTARHAIAGACVVQVVANGTRQSARIVATDPRRDLAIVQYDTKSPSRPLTLGQSGDLMIGESCVALGHPFGYTLSASRGIVSAIGRSVPMPSGEELTGLIQVDANINPGNSGGPLLNADGEWIGLMVAVRDGAQGIAFAISAETIRAMLKRYLAQAF